MDEVFYQQLPPTPGYTFELSEESHHHAIRVLRYHVGDTLWFTNGEGQFIEARLSAVSKKDSKAVIEAVVNQTFPLLARLHIAAGLLKINSRMDWIIEKGSELGLSSFIPLETERTIKQSGKTDRWDKLAISALKQSKNAWKLRVSEPASLKKQILQLPDNSLLLICHEVRMPESVTISSLDISGFSDIFLFLGPEGGFSDNEIELATQANAKLVWLGSQRLRTESAAIVALSALHQKLIVT